MGGQHNRSGQSADSTPAGDTVVPIAATGEITQLHSACHRYVVNIFDQPSTGFLWQFQWDANGTLTESSKGAASTNDTSESRPLQIIGGCADANGVPVHDEAVGFEVSTSFTFVRESPPTTFQ